MDATMIFNGNQLKMPSFYASTFTGMCLTCKGIIFQVYLDFIF